MKKPIYFLGSIVILIVVLSVTQIIVSNSLSTKGVSLGKLQDKIQANKKENMLLKEQVLTLSSFTTIASKAAEIGLQKNVSRLYMETSMPIASKQ